MRAPRRLLTPHRTLSSRRGENALGALGAGGVALLLLLALVCYIAFAWFPSWWDYMAMREITVTVARRFSEHSEVEKSKVEFASQLRAKDVSEEISPEVCDFVESGDTLTLHCAWTSYAYYPGTEYYKAFAANITANVVGAEGSYGPA